MRAIKLENQVYDIPTSWEEISVGDFEKIIPILKSVSGEKVKMRILLKIACSISGIPEQVLLEAPKQIFNLVCKEINFLFDESRDKYKMGEFVVIDSIKHYLPTEASEITTGQFIDIESLIEQDEIYSNILAILLLPKGAKHNVKDFQSRKAKIKTLAMSEALPAINFFLHSGQAYTKIFQAFFQAKAAGLQHLQRLESSVKNGDGIVQLSALQKMIYLKWIQLLKNQLLKS